VLVAVATVATGSPAVAAPAYPRASGRCVDQTGVLGPKLCAAVTAVLRRDETVSSDEIAVAVVPSTHDATIEQWTTGLFNAWGVGKADKNNGVLLVVAVDDHRVRLATGRGLASRLSDDQAAQIVDDVITPRFADDQYALGILTGLDEVRRALGHTVSPKARLAALAASAPAWPTVEPDPAAEDQPPTDSGFDGIATYPDIEVTSGFPFGFLAIALICPALVALFIFVGIRIGSSRRRTGWHGRGSTHGFVAGSTWNGSDSSSSSPFVSGFDSGSSSSFGGGSSDGGGASGSW
jgi:uncharacterized protein